MGRSDSALDDRRIETVFLDRDGTINVKAPEGAYIRRPSDLVLVPGAASAVARLNRAGVRVVLVTNQRWMSFSGAAVTDFTATQAQLATLLAEEGARLDAVYWCPHAKRACQCRKPAPGMLLRAALELSLDLARSTIVGDSVSDLAAGRAVGASAILISPRRTVHPLADAVVSDLSTAVDLVLDQARLLPFTRPSGPPKARFRRNGTSRDSEYQVNTVRSLSDKLWPSDDDG